MDLKCPVCLAEDRAAFRPVVGWINGFKTYRL